EMAISEKLAPQKREHIYIHEPMPEPISNGFVNHVGEEAERESFNYEPSPLVPSPTASANFAALEDSGTSIPPDTHGAVGPDHLMVALNTQVRIQTRTGSTISTVTLKNFWSPLGFQKGVFDPKVIYDHYANRWVFICDADSNSVNSKIFIGVT